MKDLATSLAYFCGCRLDSVLVYHICFAFNFLLFRLAYNYSQNKAITTNSCQQLYALLCDILLLNTSLTSLNPIEINGAIVPFTQWDITLFFFYLVKVLHRDTVQTGLLSHDTLHHQSYSEVSFKHRITVRYPGHDGPIDISGASYPVPCYLVTQIPWKVNAPCAGRSMYSNAALTELVAHKWDQTIY